MVNEHRMPLVCGMGKSQGNDAASQKRCKACGANANTNNAMRQERQWITVPWTTARASTGGYQHFLPKL